MNDQNFEFPIRVKRAVTHEISQRIRAKDVEALYRSFGVESLVQKRFADGPANVLDYSSGRGIEAAFVANDLKAKRLVLTALTGDDEISDDIRNLPGVEVLPINRSEPPRVDDLFDLVTIHDVLTSVPTERVTPLLAGLAGLTTKNGMVVVMLTDGVAEKVGRMRERFEKVAQDAPELFNKVVFMVEHKPDHSYPENVKEDGCEVFTHHKDDLGDQLRTQLLFENALLSDQVRIKDE